jgi:hypothetical protein
MRWVGRKKSGGIAETGRDWCSGYAENLSNLIQMQPSASLAKEFQGRCDGSQTARLIRQQ